jgi:hypothetical protein
MPDYSIAEDLDDFIEGPADLELMEGDPPPIPDAMVANRKLRRMMRLDDNAHQINHWADVEIARIQDWRATRLNTITTERLWHARALEAFMRLHAAATRETSLALSNGKLRLRKRPKSTEVFDEKALVEWAKVNRPDVLKSTVVKSRLTDGATEIVDGELGNLVDNLTGEMIPGVHTVHPSESRFYVDPGEQA